MVEMYWVMRPAYPDQEVTAIKCRRSSFWTVRADHFLHGRNSRFPLKFQIQKAAQNYLGASIAG